MTDREVLFSSRIKQAEETLSEVKRMLEDNYSCRSIINRAYYVMSCYGKTQSVYISLN